MQVEEGGGSRSALCKKQHPKCRPTGFARACTCHVYSLKRYTEKERERRGQERGKREDQHMCVDYTHTRRSDGAVACALTPARMGARA